MSFIRYLILVWHLRNTPHKTQIEFIDTLMKFGVRCAADFLHATDEIRDEKFRDYFRERALGWKQLFDPNGLKDYRQHKDYEIFELECAVRKLKEQLDITNKEVIRLQMISSDRSFKTFDPYVDDIPF